MIIIGRFPIKCHKNTLVFHTRLKNKITFIIRGHIILMARKICHDLINLKVCKDIKIQLIIQTSWHFLHFYSLFTFKDYKYLAIFQPFLICFKMCFFYCQKKSRKSQKVERLEKLVVETPNIFCSALRYVIQFDIKATKISHSQKYVQFYLVVGRS